MPENIPIEYFAMGFYLGCVISDLVNTLRNEQIVSYFADNIPEFI